MSAFAACSIVIPRLRRLATALSTSPDAMRQKMRVHGADYRGGYTQRPYEPGGETPREKTWESSLYLGSPREVEHGAGPRAVCGVPAPCPGAVVVASRPQSAFGLQSWALGHSGEHARGVVLPLDVPPTRHAPRRHTHSSRSRRAASARDIPLILLLLWRLSIIGAARAPGSEAEKIGKLTELGIHLRVLPLARGGGEGLSDIFHHKSSGP
jgi:hypothetical protein